MRTVTIFHNNDGRDARVFGYQPEHTVTEVYRYAESDYARSAVELAEKVFHLFNVGDDPAFGKPDERALDYRDRKNRSLSVGDVVRVQGQDGDHFFACASSGWSEIEAPTVANQTSNGTTPFTDDSVEADDE